MVQDSPLSRVVKELVEELMSMNRWCSHAEYDTVSKKLQHVEGQLQEEKEKNKVRSVRKRQCSDSDF